MIVHYLDACFAEPRVIPEDPLTMAQAMFIDAYAGQTLFRDAIRGLFFQYKLAERLLDQPADQIVIDSILEGPLPQSLGFLDGVVNQYGLFVGSTYTIADIAVASNLINHAYLGYRLDRGAYPALASFLDRMLRWRPFAQALAREAPSADNAGSSFYRRGSRIAKRDTLTFRPSPLP